ncbi:MAG: FHA domain-containing protein, partial [Bdellovibrionaceae bacterium]|nr:FHA domain-containing protein [Pseudobdellovibrionaceae bacterium]
MARLKIRLRGKTVSEIPLAEDRQYTAGRKDDSDIRLEAEKGISREHFRLSAGGGAWNLEVLSRFGEVQLGGEKVSTATLEHGMVFAVPPYEFEFLMTTADAPIAVTPSISDDGEGPSEDIAPPDFSLDEAPIEKTVVGVAPSVPYIKIMDSQGEPKELIRLDAGDSWIGGRESSCHIHIRDQRVSRRQFEIRKAGSQYLILDLGSVNGTLLNGNPVSGTDAVPLKSGDAITVLENYLYFELHDPNFKSRLELVNLQPVQENFSHPLVPLADQPPMPEQAYPPVVQGQYPPEAYPGGAYPPVVWDGQSYVPVAYDPQTGMPLAPMAPQAAPAKKFDFQKNRIRLILGAIIFIAGLFIMTSGDNNEDELPVQDLTAQDPLSKMTPEQKKLVRDTLQLANSYYMQGKYEFAKSELIKMTEVIPEYENSRELMKLVEEALYVQQQRRKQEELEKNQRENEEKIQRKVAECRKLINPELSRDQMEGCLSEVMIFNPAHPLFEELFSQIDRLQAEKEAEQARQSAHAAEVAKLKAVYSQAKRLDDSGKPLSAIKAYERVIASTLPDP